MIKDIIQQIENNDSTSTVNPLTIRDFRVKPEEQPISLPGGKEAIYKYNAMIRFSPVQDIKGIPSFTLIKTRRPRNNRLSTMVSGMYPDYDGDDSTIRRWWDTRNISRIGKYLRRVKNRQKLYNKLKKFGRRL